MPPIRFVFAPTVDKAFGSVGTYGSRRRAFYFKWAARPTTSLHSCEQDCFARENRSATLKVFGIVAISAMSHVTDSSPCLNRLEYYNTKKL